ncbi:MAG: DNA polymerase III subunit delta [Clostridia bacterium]|nr:DNA polymerase III subunit delta [Clostridia bacterium]
MKFLQLKQSLSTPKLAYSITGDDEFLVSQAVRIIKEGLVSCFDEFNFVKVDMDNTKTQDYANILNTMAFGDSFRVVVFYYPNAEQVKSINAQLSGLDRVVVVCVQPATKVDGAEIVDCNHLDRADLIKWLNNYLAKANAKIEKGAFDYIIDLSGGDMAYLNSELPKLTAYCGDKTISASDVDLTFTKNKNYFVYHLSNAIDLRDKKAQFEILNTLTLSQNMGEIFMFLGGYFRRMFYCSISKSSDDELANILKVKPYAISKAKQCVTKNKPKYYIDLYNKYIKLDYSIKSGDITPQNAMYELLLGIDAVK